VILKGLIVDRAVPERGDQRNKRPLEHGTLPARFAASPSTIDPAAASFNSTDRALLLKD
jgi:hypothetical protein